MNNFVWIALLALPLLCPYKSTLAQSSKISPKGSAAQQANAASTNESIETASSKAHPLMAGPPSNVTRYGGTKKIEFFNPLKQIKQGKIKYTYSDFSDEQLARAFKKDFSDEEFGWAAMKCPQLLWCKFDDPKVPAGITFLPSQDSSDPYLSQVTKWQFVASKDSMCNQHSTWEIICEDLSGTAFSSFRDTKWCFAGEKMQEKHKCFGIRVLAAKYNLEKYNAEDKFIITNINMYEKQPGYNQF